MSESGGPDPPGQIGPLGLALFSGRTHTLGNCQQAWDLLTGSGTHLQVLLQETVLSKEPHAGRLQCGRRPQVTLHVSAPPSQGVRA